MKPIIILIFILLTYQSKGQVKDKPICSGQCIGYISLMDVNKTKQGTAFGVGKRSFLTAAHVVGSQKQVYYTSFAGVSHILTVKKVDYDKDLALLTSDSDLVINPIKISSRKSIAIGEKITYIGIDMVRDQKTFKINLDAALPYAKGQLLLSKLPTEFIEFQGNSIPGYSGGPVMTQDFEVFGIICQAFNIIRPFTNQGYLANRAVFLMDFLKGVKL